MEVFAILKMATLIFLNSVSHESNLKSLSQFHGILIPQNSHFVYIFANKSAVCLQFYWHFSCLFTKCQQDCLRCQCCQSTGNLGGTFDRFAYIALQTCAKDCKLAGSCKIWPSSAKKEDSWLKMFREKN